MLRTLTDKPLAELIASCNQDRASGVLAVYSPNARRDFVFVDGEVRAARSDIDAERLGSWLVQQEIISDDDRAMCLLSQVGADPPPLGNMLIARGVTDESTLEVQLEALTFAILDAAAREPREACEFIDGTGDGQPDTLLGVTTRQLILQAARATSDPESHSRLLGSFGRLARMAGTLETIIHDFELTPAEGFVLSQVRDGTSLSKLQSVSALPHDQFAALVYGLVLAGVIELAEPQQSAGGRGSVTPAGAAAAGNSAQIDSRPASGLAAERERQEITELAARIDDMDKYQVLGLQRGASYQQIADAWQKLRVKLHPDRATQSHLADLKFPLQKIFGRAEDAYETLFNPSQRMVYDKIIGADGPTPGAVSTPDMDGEAAVSRADEARAALVRANLERADILLARAQYHEAYTLLQKACELDPQPTSLLKLARLMLRNPQWTGRALDHLRRALETDPQLVEGWLELADFWRRQGNRERQRKALHRAVRADPKNEEAAGRLRELVGPEAAEALLAQLSER